MALDDTDLLGDAQMNKLLMAIAVAATLAAASPAAAQVTYAFGDSFDDNSQLLVVNGGPTKASTFGAMGWISDAAPNTGGPDGNTDYIAGTIGSDHYANYFIFDIARLSAPVTSAALTLNAYTITGDVTYDLFDASSLLGDLPDASSPNPTLYSAMTSGTEVGSALSGGITAAGVPEPAGWTLMIGGFALAGATLRRRRAVTPAA